MSLLERTSRSGRLWARWGLLVTTAVTAAALVGLGSVSYLGARQTAASVVRARALDLAIAARRSLHLAGAPSDAVLQDLVDDMSEQGLRGVAVLPPDAPLVRAGDLSGEVIGRLSGDCRRRPGPPSLVVLDGERIGFAQPLLFGGGPGMGIGRRGRFLRRLVGIDPNTCLIVVFDPEVARALVHRAELTLLVSIAAALVLLLAAVGFWRLSLRAERDAAELLVDRHLRTLGEVSAVLGHELRNPLASLKGHAQLLVEKLDPDHPGRRGAETVVREAKRLEELTSEVLEFARTSQLRRESEDPVAIAHAALTEVESERVELEAGEVHGRALLDAPRVEQVLVNLVRNALQSSLPPAPVEVAVTLRDDLLVYEVRDHGPGVPAEELERIFEPFYTRRVRGTGLGLALARRIVEGHGGTLTAHNHPDGGAVFRVAIPVTP